MSDERLESHVVTMAKPCPHCGGTEFICENCGHEGWERTTPIAADFKKLRKELADAYELSTRILMEERQPNGEYAHLVICSGDRRQPPGRSGISCCCKVGSEQRRIFRIEMDVERLAVALCETAPSNSEHTWFLTASNTLSGRPEGPCTAHRSQAARLVGSGGVLGVRAPGGSA